MQNSPTFFSQVLLKACLIILTCFPAIQTTPAPAQSPSASPLAGIARLHQPLPPVVFDYEYEIRKHNTNLGEGGTSGTAERDPNIRHWGQTRVAGDRIDVDGRYRSWFHGTPLPEIKSRQIWDGKKYFSSNALANPGGACPEALFAEGTSMSLALKSLDYVGGFLDGRFNGLQGQDWIELAQGASDLQVAGQTETIAGIPCRRVSFRRGRVSGVVWVDEQHGGNLRQAEIAVREAPASRLRRLLPNREPVLVSSSFRLQDVEIEQVSGYYFPVSGTLISRHRYSNGKEHLSSGHIRRSKLTLNPDFSAMKAFKPDWAEGTIVDNAQMTLKYLWHNGELVPFVDPSVEADARWIVQQMRASPKTGLPLWLRSSEIAADSRGALSKQAVTSRTAAVDPCSDPVGPRSGLYCLYTALLLSGKDVPLADLLRPEYIPSYEGSSAFELVGAARRYHLYALTLSGLTYRSLRQVQQPAILRVKGKSYSKKYDSWELYLGPKDGAAWLYSPLQGLRKEAFATLAARWDGSAVILSRKPVHRLPIVFPDLLFYAASAVVLMLFLLITRKYLRDWGSAGPAMGRLPFLRRSQAEFFAFIGLAIGMGCLWHVIAANGLLTSNGNIGYVQLSRKGNFLPRVTMGQVQQIVNGHEEAILMDARDSFSYLMGHIPTARNVPIVLPDQERKKSLQGVPKDARIIVYCGSESCAIADNMTARLASDGFKNLSVYSGGWQEWEKQGEKQS